MRRGPIYIELSILKCKRGYILTQYLKKWLGGGEQKSKGMKQELLKYIYVVVSNYMVRQAEYNV